MIDLNLTHLHLMLNHVPTVGTVVALGLLLLALARRNDALTHVGMEVLYLIALLTLPAYLTGLAAQRMIRDLPGVSSDAMFAHHDAALAGFAVVEFAGFMAWLALWQTRRAGRPARGLVATSIVLVTIALALMGRAATLGGEIRHPEIRGGDPAAVTEALTPEAARDAQSAAANASRFVTAAISDYSVNSTWAWPAGEALHFIGLSLSLGVLIAVNLRILGVMRQVPFEMVHRLLPWGMLGFGINLITGMFFAIGQPGQYVESAPMYWKVAFLMVAGANYLYVTVFRRPWTEHSFVFGLGDKAMAVSALAAWLIVLVAGRMLPFLGDAF